MDKIGNVPANTVNETALTPDLRRKIGGGSSTSVTIYNSDAAVNPDTKYYDIIAKIVILENVSLAAQLSLYDGVQIETEDTLLLNGQADKTENGVYVNKSTGLERLAFELSPGKPVFISHGSHMMSCWVISNEKVIIGETQLIFIKVYPFDSKFINAQLGFLNFYVKSLWETCPALNNTRWDDPVLANADMNRIINNSAKTYLKLYFQNEVINGNKMLIVDDIQANAAQKYNVFVCEKPGVYDVYFFLDLDLVLTAYPPECAGDLSLDVELWIIREEYDPNDYPNGKMYSLIASDTKYQFATYKPVLEIDIDIYPLRFNPKGYDAVNLRAGDRLYFRMAGDGWYGVYGSAIPPGQSSAIVCSGRITFEYRNCGSVDINETVNI